jgi:phosphatidylserine decarboxylase
MSLIGRLLPARQDDLPVDGTLREGWPYIVGPALLGLLAWRWRPLVGAALLLLAAGIASFFRDPVRRLTPDPDLLYAPADGTVIGVDTVDDPWFVGRRSFRISIFLSLLNVHVNRSPVDSTLTAMRDLGTNFAPAMSFERSHSNRRRELGMDTSHGPILVVQAAGLLARRIVGWVDPGDRLAAGQKIGMITFGSRTDLIVPHDSAEPIAEIGQQVLGGRTPIARWLAPVSIGESVS